MNPITRRAVALAALLLISLLVSGATFAVAAFPSPGSADSCCFPAGNDEELPQPPCSTPDCPCLFCLNLHSTRSADISIQPLYTACPVFLPHSSPLAAFVRAIDYPPEHS